jgi:hypothetical protein
MEAGKIRVTLLIVHRGPHDEVSSSVLNISGIKAWRIDELTIVRMRIMRFGYTARKAATAASTILLVIVSRSASSLASAAAIMALVAASTPHRTGFVTYDETPAGIFAVAHLTPCEFARNQPL